ncbi:MAG: DUF2171 domain-containing protein [Nitrososphaeraceae archaeon]
MSGSSGPSILWNQLKGKKVKTHDGKDIGEIDEISQNYLRLEKGTISKDKFWIPKYIVDTFDGDNVWVIASKDEVKERYLFGQEPPNEQFTRDLEEFKTTKGMDVYNSEGVRIRKSSTQQDESTERSSTDEYKNIRDLEK